MSNSNSSTEPFDLDLAYRLLLGSRNRAGMPPPAPLDEIWRNRLDAAIIEIESRGIKLDNNVDDLMLAADYASYLLDCREKGGSMPEWLRFRLSQRWISQYKRAGDST